MPTHAINRETDLIYEYLNGALEHLKIKSISPSIDGHCINQFCSDNGDRRRKREGGRGWNREPAQNSFTSGKMNGNRLFTAVFIQVCMTS